jgi:hypothetical protein
MTPKSFKVLPLTLSIETLGGISTPIVRRGTPLPATRKQTFSTTADNQKAITILVYFGESPIAANNIRLTRCELTDLQQAPKGGIEVDVTFQVDEQCHIRITTIDKKSRKQISYNVKTPSRLLTKEKVEEILAKTTASMKEDTKVADSIQARNRATNLLTRAEHYLATYTDRQIDEAIASLGLSLETNDLGQIITNTNRLEQLLPKSTFEPFFDGFNFGNAFDDVFSPSGARQRQPSKGSHYRPSRETPKDEVSHEQKTTKSAEIVNSDKGILFAGQYFDAKKLVRDLFADAQNEIIVIDPYVGEDVLALLAVKRPGVSVKILTGKTSPPLLTLTRDFNRQYKAIELRSSNTFHDRFVIIDQKDHYHFGASLEHLGNKTFMFSKIEEPIMIEALQTHWRKAWEEASRQL